MEILKLEIIRDESGTFFVRDKYNVYGANFELHLAMIDYSIKLRDHYRLLYDSDPEDLGEKFKEDLVDLTTLFEMPQEKQS